jgi:hypothetical protein
MDQKNVLLEKDGFVFAKLQSNNYEMSFSIENKNIHLAKVVNFELFKLIYDLNPEIYESVHLEKTNNDEAIVTLVMKHFFEDIGIPQKYSYMHIKRSVHSNCITFDAEVIRSTRPDNVPIDAQLVAFSNVVCICQLETAHKINFKYNIQLDENHVMPPFLEKFISNISNKICKRVKQFIENFVL